MASPQARGLNRFNNPSSNSLEEIKTQVNNLKANVNN